MKVVILNNDFRAYWKGRLIYLHRFLADHNIDFYAVELFGKGSPYAFDEVENTHPWWTCLFPDSSPLGLNRFDIKRSIDDVLDKIRPDVVIGPSIVFFPGALGIAWAKRNQRKFIMFDDAKPSQVKRNFVVQTIKDCITEQADSLWLPSATYNLEWGHFKQRGVHFFYGFNSIDNKAFSSLKRYQSDSKQIICVARLVPVKNIENLLQAWQLVEGQAKDYGLTILGNGPSEDNLKQLSAQLGLTSVEFIDSVDNKSLPHYLQGAAAFILPSQSETWGLVVNEAMAAGLPVLLSNKINAAGDLLQDGQNGFGFSPDDVPGIANAILHFINSDAETKMAMSYTSLNLVSNFSFEKMGKQLVVELRRLQATKFKRPGMIPAALINLWYGRYNTAGWDTLDNKKK